MSDDFEELDLDFEDQEPPTDDFPSTGKVKVFFQSTIGPSQRKEDMEISLGAPVREVHYTISQLFSLNTSDFLLSHAGRTLDPDDIMGNYEINDGDTILIIPVSTAG